MKPDDIADAELVFGVSDFIALVNQTLDYVFPTVIIRGELASFKVSKGRWVYFDLKDDSATVRFFGTVYQLIGPLEDGMLLRVRGTPRLHPKYGFSITILNIQPEGEGTIHRIAELLRRKLEAEGLFDPARKRPLPYPPTQIGLITSAESAAYVDFLKILNARWGGMSIVCLDTQVQGEAAPAQIVAAIDYFNHLARLPEVLVLTRGGGSPEDLYAFNTEPVARAVAASRVPTLVAIGHEIDVSLAELAADQRASTPSNAAELLVPDRREVSRQLVEMSKALRSSVITHLHANSQIVYQLRVMLKQALTAAIRRSRAHLASAQQLFVVLNPKNVLSRGYAIVRLPNRQLVRRIEDVSSGDLLSIEVSNGKIDAAVR